MTESDGSFVPSAELWTLISGSGDGTLTETQRDRLEELLVDGGVAATQFYVDYLDLHATLAWRYRDGAIDLPAETSSEIAEMHAVPASSGITNSESATAGSGARFSLARADRLVVAVAVLMLLVPLGVFWISTSGSSSAATELRIGAVTGNVQLTDTAGAPVRITADMLIRAGSTVRTIGEQSLVTLAFADATRLLIAGDSVATIANLQRKEVQLEQGTISASVTPQGSSPMLVETPQASVEVLGTEFSLSSTSEQTNVRVTEGKVKFTRHAGGESVVVAQGKQAVTGARSSDVVVRTTESRPEVWDEDFENGIPDDWRHAGCVDESLPEGSLGAARAIVGLERDDWFALKSPSRWIDGLFEIHADSHLNLIYKMDDPSWINIFMITRNNDLEQPRISLNLFNTMRTPFDTAGEWRHASIPIAAFHRKVDGQFSEQSPFEGDLCFGMMWSWFEADRGFVVDRVWISRGGPGVVQVEPLSN